MLELRAIGTGLLRQGHQVKCALQVTIVIRSNIGDEVRGFARTHATSTYCEGRHVGHSSATDWRFSVLRAHSELCARLPG